MNTTTNYMEVSNTPIAMATIMASGSQAALNALDWFFKKKTQDTNKLAKVIEQVYPKYETK